MNEVLSSIYVRLNVNMQNLSSKAIAQLIVKIVFQHEGGMTKQEICDTIASVNISKHIDNNEIEDVLKNLVPDELGFSKGRYYLSKSKRVNIEKSVSEANTRIHEIIRRFFTNLNTPEDELINWLDDITTRFFESYSEEWISDLTAKTNNIGRSTDSILKLISNRTNDLKSIDTNDKKFLPEKFKDFVLSRDPIVDSYLWDYGTSAFASRLIRTMYGVDQITLDTFKGSTCILDTNILMFIALESRFKDALVSIEKVFNDLNIKAKLLYITQREYNNKINSQRGLTLHNFSKYGEEIALLPNDDFTELLKNSHCYTQEDIERCFDISLKRPEYIHDKVRIELKDDDKTLAEIVDNAGKNDDKLSKLQSFVKHEKSRSSLMHDIGLIEGVKYLRNKEDSEKYFILSEEMSVNQYSKQSGLKDGLPLSLRVDTLINLLAVNNGADTFEANDYMPLFANIIRMGLIPQKETFRQTELYQFYQMNSKISTLPKEKTEQIVTELHAQMVQGKPEDEIRRNLEEMITKGEIQMSQQLDDTKGALDFQKRETKRLSEGYESIKKALRSQIEKNVTIDYDRETQNTKKMIRCIIPIVVLVVSVIYIIESKSYINLDENLPSIVLSIVLNLLSTVICWLISNYIYLKKRSNERDTYVHNETERRLEQSM